MSIFIFFLHTQWSVYCNTINYHQVSFRFDQTPLTMTLAVML